MQFQCRLGTATGEILEGIYAAADEAALRRELEDQGLHVLSLRRRGGVAWSALRRPRARRISTRDFIIFNQELAALLRAGLPLVQSLDILRQRVDNPLMKSVLDDVHDRVRSGAALSEAFEAHGGLFPAVYTASLLAGEKSGSLEQVLRRYIAYARLTSSVRRKTISALVYPAVLLALSLTVVAIIVLRVVPEFGAFYGSLGAELPAATRVIVALSDLATRFAVVWIAGGMALAGLVWVWLSRPEAGAKVDHVLLQLPGIGEVARRFATSQLARTLATLLRGGIPLVDALDVSVRSIGNRHVARELQTVSRDVREGQPLSVSLVARDICPPVAIKMIEVGEATGALQDMLGSVADFFDEENETTLNRLMALIEPLMLVVMGIVIAGLLLALYMPLLQLGAIA